MATRHINGALRKPWNERLTSVRFHFRRSLAKLPYVPVPLRLPISQAQTLEFWWSYVAPFYDPSRGFFDYWGHDIGDLRFLWKFLEPGMVFFDVGAYHGIYSLAAAKRLGATGRVVAFEPSPRECRRLRLHLRWNGFRTACVEPLAVGAAHQEATFFQVLSGDMTRNGLRPPVSSDTVAPLSVKTVSLDRYVSELSLNRLDLVKMDVEGGELEALRGASRVLAELRPVLICEVLDAATQPWGYPAREIMRALQRHDYAWFDFRPDGTLGAHEIRDRYPEVRNYLAVPRERCGAAREGVLP
jgi:FkbM family methyltransferase